MEDLFQMLVAFMFSQPGYVVFKIGPNEYADCPLQRVYPY